MAVHATDTTLRTHVECVHLKEMPTLTLIKATALRAMDDVERSSVINVPTKKRRRSEAGTSDTNDTSIATSPANQALRNPDIPAHPRLPPSWTPQEQLVAIRRLLFLEEEHDANFHRLAIAHLQQTTYCTPSSDNQQLSLDAATSFLRIYGLQLWPTSPEQRSHLSTVSTVRNSIFWRGKGKDSDDSLSGPYFTLDSVMSTKTLKFWRKDHAHTKGGPTKADALGCSKLGELMKTYFAIMLVLGDTGTAQSKIAMNPNKLIEKIIGGGQTLPTAKKQKSPATLLVRLPIGGVLPKPPTVKQNPLASLMVRLPVVVAERSSSPDIPLSSIIDEWRSARDVDIPHPHPKRLKVPEPKPRRQRPPVGKIITSPLPPSSFRAESQPIAHGTFARVQALQHADRTQSGVQRSPLFPHGAGPHSQPPRMEVTSQPLSINTAGHGFFGAHVPAPPRLRTRHSLPNFPPAHQTTHVQPHPFLRLKETTVAPTNTQLPTPTSTVQLSPRQPSFDDHLQQHIASQRRSLPSSFDMPPPARPWPTMPVPYITYQLPRMPVTAPDAEAPVCGPKIWSPEEQHEMMDRMGVLSGESWMSQREQEELKRCEMQRKELEKRERERRHIGLEERCKMYERQAGSLGGLPFC